MSVNIDVRSNGLPASFAGALDTLPIVAFIGAPDGTIRYVSRAWTEFTGCPAAEAIGTGCRHLLDPADADRVVATWLAACSRNEPYRDEFRMRVHDGTYRWVLGRAAPLRDPDTGAISDWFGTVTDIDERKRSPNALRESDAKDFGPERGDGAALAPAPVSRDSSEHERIEDGLRLLSRTGAAIVDSLDYARTLRKIAQAFVDGFAAYCLIDVMPADGPWERTLEHRDPALVPLLQRLSRPKGNHPIARAIEAGESAFTSIDERWAHGLDGELDADRLEAVRRLHVRSIICVPVVTPAGEVVGALTCALDDRDLRENYGRNDLGFVEEVGRRAGAAIANVRLYERERRIAIEMQSACLPKYLPAVTNIVLDAAYRPASKEASIGGDWYDAFLLPDARLIITVGDVIGHGLQAAVSMMKLRIAMKAAAMVDADPNVILRVADATLRSSDPNAYATAIAAVYDPANRTVTFASAGHPGPVRRTADGHIEEFTNFGPMLGLRNGDETGTITIATPPGSTLVFYTDGLVEFGRNLDDGFARLSDALRSMDFMKAIRRADSLVDTVLGADEARDDIAVLVVDFAR